MEVAQRWDRAVGRARVASRWARTLATRPEEAFDRYRTRQIAMGEPRTGTNDGAQEAWRLLTEAWGHDPDEAISGFVDTWDRLWRDAERFRGHGSRHDGDVELARCLWVAVRLLAPQQVVETGVARGVSSAVILGALDANGHGSLTSIDLPPLSDPWYRSSGQLVPGHLRQRWTFLHGDARRVLPKVLVDAGQVDLFLHDSLHTRDHMAFELTLASRFLSPGGALVADDINFNSAFDELTSKEEFAGHLRGRHAEKSGAFGVAWRDTTTSTA